MRDPSRPVVELAVRAHLFALPQRHVGGTGSGMGEQACILVAGL
jgi:hypothetical protein